MNQVMRDAITDRWLLGSQLIERQLITQKQLDEAIEHKSIFGGRLGTCLLELGLVDEETLAGTLADQQQCPYFPPAALMDIPGDILKLIPVKTVLKQKILPFHQDNSSLYVAVVDQGDGSLFSVLSGLTGRRIVPVLFPEIRILIALNMYFSRPLAPRYEQLARALKQPSRKPANHSPGHSKPQPELAVPPSTKPGSPLVDAGDHDRKPDQDPGHLKTAVDFHTADRTYQDLLHTLCDIRDRDQIAQSLLSFLAPYCHGCALLTVREGTLSGWKCSRKDRGDKFSLIQLELDRTEPFGTTVRTRKPYCGDFPRDREGTKIRPFFPSAPAHRFLIVPIAIKGRTVSVLCLQVPHSDLEQIRPLLDAVIRKIELAFQLVIFKKKILSC